MPIRSRQKSLRAELRRDVAAGRCGRRCRRRTSSSLRRAGGRARRARPGFRRARSRRSAPRRRPTGPTGSCRSSASAAADRRRPWRRGPGTCLRCGTPRRASTASASANQNPALWRVPAYSRPGLPSPATRRIGAMPSAPRHWRGCSTRCAHRVDSQHRRRAVKKARRDARGGPSCRRRRQWALTSSCRPCRIPSCRRPSRRHPSRRRPWRRRQAPHRARRPRRRRPRLRRQRLRWPPRPAPSARRRTATTGSSLPRVTTVTPGGSCSADTCTEWPTSSVDRSTVMNSGRSFGRQEMSSSVSTWLTIAPDTFTAGEFSPLAKCSGTFMWILRFSSMRWKSTCRISFLNGCICTSRSSTFVTAPSRLHAEDRRVERLVAQRVEERVVVELDRLRRGGAAVDDAGRLAGAAHAAARAAAFGRAGKCGEFDIAWCGS